VEVFDIDEKEYHKYNQDRAKGLKNLKYKFLAGKKQFPLPPLKQEGKKSLQSTKVEDNKPIKINKNTMVDKKPKIVASPQKLKEIKVFKIDDLILSLQDFKRSTAYSKVQMKKEQYAKTVRMVLYFRTHSSLDTKEILKLLESIYKGLLDSYESTLYLDEIIKNIEGLR
jgi:superfamily II helicase